MEIKVEDVMRICGCGKSTAYNKLKQMRAYIGHREFYTHWDFEIWRIQDKDNLTKNEQGDLLEKVCSIIIEKHSHPTRRKIAKPNSPGLSETIKEVCAAYKVNEEVIKRILIG